MRRKLHRLVCSACLATLTIASWLPARAQAPSTPTASGRIAQLESCSWSPIDIGDLGGAPIGHINAAYGINERRQVVGESTTAANVVHAFLWEDGTMTDLGTLGTSSSSTSRALGINNRGQIVGTSDGEAFLWQDGAMTGLGKPAGATLSVAYGINDRGQVIGSSVHPGAGGTFTHRAWVWERESATELPGLPGATQTHPRGINNRGDIVGESGTLEARFLYHAVLWERGKLTDLGTLPGGDSSSAWDINDRGLIAGWSNIASGEIHAVLWQDGTIVDLGICDDNVFGGCPIRLNERGQAVGKAVVPGPYGHVEIHGALWDHGAQIDLSTFPGSPDFYYTAAWDINNSGEIVGTAPSFGSRAIVWPSCHGQRAGD